jgi:hypothetical protein
MFCRLPGKGCFFFVRLRDFVFPAAEFPARRFCCAVRKSVFSCLPGRDRNFGADTLPFQALKPALRGFFHAWKRFFAGFSVTFAVSGAVLAVKPVLMEPVFLEYKCNIKQKIRHAIQDRKGGFYGINIPYKTLQQATD